MDTSTAVVGKWHLGFHYEMPAGTPMDDAMRVARTVPLGSRVIEGPITRGFDRFYGYHHGGEIRTWIENDRVVEHLAELTMKCYRGFVTRVLVI